MDTEQQNAMSEPIPQNYLEASRLYSAFIDAVSLPSIYDKKTADIAAAQLEQDYAKHSFGFDDVEVALWRNYIHLLKTIKQANEDEHTR